MPKRKYIPYATCVFAVGLSVLSGSGFSQEAQAGKAKKAAPEVYSAVEDSSLPAEAALIATAEETSSAVTASAPITASANQKSPSPAVTAPAAPAAPIAPPQTPTLPPPALTQAPIFVPIPTIATVPTSASAPAPYDSVPNDQVEAISSRLKLAEQLIRRHGRAYDYRIHTVKELETILAGLDAGTPSTMTLAAAPKSQDMGTPAPMAGVITTQQSADADPSSPPPFLPF